MKKKGRRIRKKLCDEKTIPPQNDNELTGKEIENDNTAMGNTIKPTSFATTISINIGLVLPNKKSIQDPGLSIKSMRKIRLPINDSITLTSAKKEQRPARDFSSALIR